MYLVADMKVPQGVAMVLLNEHVDELLHGGSYQFMGVTSTVIA